MSQNNTQDSYSAMTLQTIYRPMPTSPAIKRHTQGSHSLFIYKFKHFFKHLSMTNVHTVYIAAASPQV